MSFAAELIRWISWKLQIGESNALVDDLVCLDIRRCFIPHSTAGSNVVVLINAITAYSQAANQDAIPIQSQASRKEDDPALFHACWRLGALRAGVMDVIHEELKERPIRRAVNARGIQGLR